MRTGTQPLVSIVTPCLNPGERLRRCLQSVAEQTYRGIEHIVIDGGSDDGTVEVLRGSQGIRWVSEPDGGQADAINRGFALAGGGILGWLNADDVLMPDAVARVAEAFGRDPALGLVYGDCRIVEGGRELLTWRAPRRLTMSVLEGGFSIPQPGAFTARWALDRVGGLDDSFELAMDVDLWLRLLVAGVPAARVPGVVSVFELHSRSKTGSVPRQRFYEENARAYLLAGRTHAAALSLGQSAAAAAESDGGRIDDRRLQEGIAAACTLTDGWDERPSARTIRAAALAEAAVIELRTSGSGLRHLLATDVWLDRSVRKRLRAAARRGAPRLARRALHRSS
ncbi:MAG TPA: glycosyltransferase family 2 protein [Gaiellaceae bacterium]|jgi:GT2 family glycosyltransferase|nr:glycosyltransferase family 2 protein [Gaiellaceae bacterium]